MRSLFVNKIRNYILVIILFYAFCFSQAAYSQSVSFKNNCLYFLKSIKGNWNPLKKSLSLSYQNQQIVMDISTSMNNAFAELIEYLKKSNEIDEIQERFQYILNWNLNLDQINKLKEVLKPWELLVKNKSSDKNLVQFVNTINYKLELLNKNKDSFIAPYDSNQGSNPNLEIFKKLSKKVKIISKLPDKILSDLEEILMQGELSSDLSGQNSGIINFLYKKIESNSILFSDSLAFYSMLLQVDSHPISKGKYVDSLLQDFNSPVNIWNLALSITNNDIFRALDVISVYGHDDILHQLNAGLYGMSGSGKNSKWPLTLDAFHPNSDSILYRNGAFDGLSPPVSLINKFKKIQNEIARDLNVNPKSLENDPRFRSGNYHFIGGAFLCAELIRKGYDRFLGFNIPVIISELAGSLYKLKTMESTYLAPLALNLYRKGYPFKEVVLPQSIDPKELKEAKLSVRLNLLHLELTRLQHRMGAEWFYGLVENAKKTK